MRTVIFFRHAKSDWHAGSGGDHERPLNARGRKAARVMGRFLRASGQVPDLAVTSTALRARSTLDLAREAGAWECPVRSADSLYETTPERVLEEIQETEDRAESLLLVGHEPTWSGMIALFTGGAQVRFPTAALARIDFAVGGWKQVRFESGQLIWLIPPKVFTEGDFGFTS